MNASFWWPRFKADVKDYVSFCHVIKAAIAKLADLL